MLKKKRSQKQGFFPAKIFPKSRSGQITIFIIMAIVIVASVTLFFVFRKGMQKTGVSEDVDVNAFLKICMEDKIHEGLELIGIQGGSINPWLYKRFKFDDEPYKNISYLCYTSDIITPCVNLEPALITHAEKELKKYISNDVEGCFNGLVLSLEKQGYEIENAYENFDIGFLPGKIEVKINGEVTLAKSGETKKYSKMEIISPTKFYELAYTAKEIVNQQAKNCYFPEVGYMISYPEYYIDSENIGDSSIIYTVEHRKTKEKFRFAIRGCVPIPKY